MKLQLLGTGAADGIPGLFSNDPVSSFAREHSGRELRSRASALLDGILQIDLSPDVFHQINRFGVNPCDWKALFFTHSDDDHVAVNEIQYALYPFTTADHLDLTIFANAKVTEIIRDRYPDWPLDLVETTSFVPIQFAEYNVTPIRANHIPGEDCHNFIFEKDGRSILYATDTGILPEETFEFLAGRALDAMVLECTDGLAQGTYAGHLCLQSFYDTINRLKGSGALSSDCKIASTHHSCRGEMTYRDLAAELEPKGIIAGFDGVILEA